MQALIVTDATQTAIIELKAYAAAHPFTVADMYAIIQGRALPPGERPAHTLAIEIGWNIVYTVEVRPQGHFVHLSASVNGGYPNPDALRLLLEEFGFARKLEQCLVYTEQGYAINVLEPYHPAP